MNMTKTFNYLDMRDLPIDDKEHDLLNLNHHAESLVAFLLKSDTPITVSIQGEWGSGKTSLMHLIEKNMSQDNGVGYEPIWINTWEYYLDNKENSIEKVILSIINRITKIGKAKGKSYTSEVKTILDALRDFSQRAVNVLLSSVGVDESARKSVLGLFDKNNVNLVRNLRNSIESLIRKLVEEDKNITKGGFVFFIDDLDRIEPVNAVQLIDIFKNIFEIKYCIFILAIDYEVIVKGLRRKYGEYKAKDEVYYRSYFDKMIQLPFVMPVLSYDIKKMITASLLQMNYISELDEFSHLTYSQIMNSVKYTVGNNPRRIKRLINAVNLSYIYDQSKYRILSSETMKLLNIVLICIQQAYPKIYNYLCANPDFKSWDESDFVYEFAKSNMDDIVENNITHLLHWEKLLYKICVVDPVLDGFTSNVQAIFKILDSLLVENKINITNIKHTIKLSSMTNLSYSLEREVVFDGSKYDASSQTQYAQSDYLLNHTFIPNHSYILDIGCGNGKTTIKFFEKNKTVNIDAFDINESQIDIAIKNRNDAGYSKEQIHFFQFDAYNLTETNKYNIIISNASLHWITNGKEIYQKIYEALAAGGRISIHQGGKNSYCGLHSVVKEAISSLKYDHYFENWSVPLFYPTKQEMEQILYDIGFSNITVESVESDGSEYESLVDNFANASLLPYLSRLSKKNSEILKSEFFRLCQTRNINRYTHRLYIFASKEE